MDSSEKGSALVDFVLMAAPFVLVPLSVVSISMNSYAQTVLQDSAIEGARFAALADQDSSSGCGRSLHLARQAFVGFRDLTATCRVVSQGQRDMEQVVIAGKVPVFGILSFSSAHSATARAPREN